MIKKFAMLATVAALFVACSGNTAEDAAAQAQATQDSIKMVDQAAADAKAAAEAAAMTADSTANAMADTANKMMDESTTK